MRIDSFLNRKTSHFLAIYEAGNIHRAAEEIGLTQPALTMSLKQLEAELGGPLFQRSVKGLTPTQAGRTYYRYACTLRQSSAYAASEISAQFSGGSGILRIGAGVGWATTIIPSTLIELSQRYPNLSIELITGVADQLATLLETGKIDVLLAAGSVKPLDAPEYHQAFLINIPMVAVTDSQSELAGKDIVTMQELSRANWAGFYEDNAFVHHANHFMALHGLPTPNIVMRTNSVTALTEFVKGTSMVTIVTSPLAAKARESGLMRLSLSRPLWEIPVSLYLREVAKEIETVRCFMSLVKKQIDDLATEHGREHRGYSGLFASF